MDKKNILSMVSLFVLLCGCTGDGHKDDNEVNATINSFASAYFNYDFKKAMLCVTPESERWLRFSASNVIEEDVELLRAQTEGATHEVENISYPSDTVAVVRCRIENYLKRDTLGRAGHVVKKGRVNIKVVKRNGQWLVDAASVCSAR